MIDHLLEAYDDDDKESKNDENDCRDNKGRHLFLSNIEQNFCRTTWVRQHMSRR
jgi:hypothetical protein